MQAHTTTDALDSTYRLTGRTGQTCQHTVGQRTREDQKRASFDAKRTKMYSVLVQVLASVASPF